MSKKVLFAGKSWMSYITHVKGFDTFYTSVYESGKKYLKSALEEGGYKVTYMPNHEAMEHCEGVHPETVKEHEIVKDFCLSQSRSGGLSCRCSRRGRRAAFRCLKKGRCQYR